MTRKSTPKVKKLLEILSDGRWHSTKELRRRVGRTFGMTKFYLMVQCGYFIERQPHPTQKHQHKYRLLDETEV